MRRKPARCPRCWKKGVGGQEMVPMAGSDYEGAEGGWLHLCPKPLGGPLILIVPSFPCLKRRDDIQTPPKKPKPSASRLLIAGGLLLKFTGWQNNEKKRRGGLSVCVRSDGCPGVGVGGPEQNPDPETNMLRHCSGAP